VAGERRDGLAGAFDRAGVAGPTIVGAAERDVGADLQRPIIERGRDGAGPLSGVEGTVEVTQRPQGVGHVGEDPAEPPPVLELFGERLGLSKLGETAPGLAQHRERPMELEPHIDRAFDGLARGGETRERLGRLLEADDGLAESRTLGGRGSSLAKARRRPLPGLALAVVTT